ncbi:MAG: nicotinate-nucleotide--dimethylbenzimidazole phosphoribosyltransferase [Myxococcota bacterium]
MLFRVPEFDAASCEETRARLSALAKPPGSLARLEELCATLAGVQRRVPPSAAVAAAVVFAADHGVASAHTVSAYPTSVTPLMARTIARGEASINAIARSQGARVLLVDVGVAGGFDQSVVADDVHVLGESVCPGGTADMVERAAMRLDEVHGAMGVGAGVADWCAEHGVQVLALGELGIGNTTASSALASAVLGLAPSEVVGPGTGLDAQGVGRKREVVVRALARAGASARTPLGALSEVGGAEHAALVGCMLRCASHGIVTLVDGFIVSAAALVALRLVPQWGPYIVCATQSAEPGHRALTQALGRAPLLDLGLRLGEGTGAALAIGVVRASCALVREVATLEDVLGVHP